MQRRATLIATVLQAGANMISLQRPIGQTCCKGRVHHAISVIEHDFDVIYEGFAFVQQPDLRVINRRIIVRAVVEYTGIFNICPNRFGSLITIRPVGREPVVRLRIHRAN